MAKTKKLTAREWIKNKFPNWKNDFYCHSFDKTELIKLLNGFASQFKPKPTRRKKEDLRPGKGINPGHPENDPQNDINKG